MGSFIIPNDILNIFQLRVLESKNELICFGIYHL